MAKGTRFGREFRFCFGVVLGQESQVAPGSRKVKNVHRLEWVLTISKDAARLGDLGKRAFGPNIPNIWGK